jgi:hypothetical protein
MAQNFEDVKQYYLRRSVIILREDLGKQIEEVASADDHKVFNVDGELKGSDYVLEEAKKYMDANGCSWGSIMRFGTVNKYLEHKRRG